MLLNKVYQHQRTPMQYAYRLFFLLLRNQVGFEFSNQSSRPFVSEQYEIINAIIEPSRHHDILFSMGVMDGLQFPSLAIDYLRS